MIDTLELRKYGFLMAGMFAAVFGVLGPLLRSAPTPYWPFAVALVFAALATAKPAALKPVHAAWMKLGHLLGAINSRIILTAVYFVVVFPYGMLLRAFRHDPLARKKDSAAATYRKVVRPVLAIKSSLERPY